MRRCQTFLKNSIVSVAQWFDADYHKETSSAIAAKPDKVEWVRTLPFLILHAGCLGVIWVGWSWTAVLTAAALYFIRMFAITGFYHRYFSHRTFHTSRAAQFLFAVIGASAVQRGPLWWSYQHRHHHQHSDEEDDVHSPWQRRVLVGAHRLDHQRAKFPHRLLAGARPGQIPGTGFFEPL